jgi:hypothetical protein
MTKYSRRLPLPLLQGLLQVPGTHDPARTMPQEMTAAGAGLTLTTNASKAAACKSVCMYAVAITCGAAASLVQVQHWPEFASLWTDSENYRNARSAPHHMLL